MASAGGVLLTFPVYLCGETFLVGDLGLVNDLDGPLGLGRAVDALVDPNGRLTGILDLGIMEAVAVATDRF